MVSSPILVELTLVGAGMRTRPYRAGTYWLLTGPGIAAQTTALVVKARTVGVQQFFLHSFAGGHELPLYLVVLGPGDHDLRLCHRVRFQQLDAQGRGRVESVQSRVFPLFDAS